MAIIRVILQLCFINAPNNQAGRAFRSMLLVKDPNNHGYHEIRDIVREKLRFINVATCNFTVFHEDSKTSDIVVVDDAYFRELLFNVVGNTLASKKPVTAIPHLANVYGGRSVCGRDEILGGSYPEREEHEEMFESDVVRFKVEVDPVKPAGQNLGDQGLGITVLKTEDSVIHNVSGTLVSIGALTFPLKHPNTFIRGVVIAIRFRTTNIGKTVCQLDLCERTDPHQQITVVTFNTEIQNAIRNTLKNDRRHVVEVRNMNIHVKNETDKCFQTNSHPLQIRLNCGGRIEVVQFLPIPFTLPVEQAVTVRETLLPTGVLTIGELAAMQSGQQPTKPTSKAAHNASTTGASSSSSSSLSAYGSARKTMLSLNSAGSKVTAPVSGIVPSGLGEAMRHQQANFLSKRPREELPPHEPDTEHTTMRDVRMRDIVIARDALREEGEKNRIRVRKEVSQRCIICGIDCGDERSITVVANMLKKSTQNMGRHIPTMDELRSALCDKRQAKLANVRDRLVCKQYFVNVKTKLPHVVHCRCAHLCSSYQEGRDLEDVVALELDGQYCHLCGESGASVACYHPDCKEMYHTVCALFSFGYVNFGKKDPYLPCPACPRHTQVNVSNTTNKAPIVNPRAMPEWWEEDGIAFDSRVVEESDLRDPDENDGK
uniref:Uncharacterized protein TCIL3000_9_5550 n=1 Tax=Trypanosoma congolense (strain IL3000) TaxID=1068625 RepID=G0UUT3_TRYCI|nr:unnamed protein product [Trypanosoma congolense IL3000]